MVRGKKEKFWIFFFVTFSAAFASSHRGSRLPARDSGFTDFPPYGWPL